MIREKNIIIIGGIDWDGGRKLPIHHVAERLARRNRVYYVDNFGAVRDFALSDIPRAVKKVVKAIRHGRGNAPAAEEVDEKVRVWRPIIVPVPRLPLLIGRINVFLLKRSLKRLVRIYGIKDPVFWTRVPTDLVWRSIEGLPRKMLIYQSVDKFPYSPKISESLRSGYVDSEMKFCVSSDIVFASARGLCEEKKRINPNTYFFPNGVDPGFFGSPREKDPCGKIKKPIIGFAGALGTWVDFDMILEAAKERPLYSFVLIGPLAPEVDLSGLRKLSNIYFPGAVKYADLPGWFNKFDVGLIPYRITEFTNYTFPSKMAEYLTSGLPVISTPLPEVLPYSGIVKIVKDPREMILAIDAAVNEGGNEERRAGRRSLAETLSWDNIVSGMETIIDERLQNMGENNLI